MQSNLIIEQKITAFTNQYVVYAADATGNKQQQVAFAQQKRLAFKEKVQFYTSEDKVILAFSFRAEKVMDIHGNFLVEDAEGNLIGKFRKDFSKSLLVSTWHILDATDTVKLTFAESNKVLAILRRYGGFVPIVGDVLDIILAFFKYHFRVTDASGNVIGKYQKTTLFRDHYSLQLQDQPQSVDTDWRVLAAMAVALDALQSR